jgi:hypothetical protein
MHNRKLRLNVDDLSVESFVPAVQAESRGTVRGAEFSDAGSECCVPSYDQPQSCDWTHCANISCLGGNCGGGGATRIGETCDRTCLLNPVIE